MSPDYGKTVYQQVRNGFRGRAVVGYATTLTPGLGRQYITHQTPPSTVTTPKDTTRWWIWAGNRKPKLKVTT